MSNENVKTVLLAMACIVIALLALRSCDNAPPATIERVQYDTITQTITQPPIYVRSRATRITDTIYLSLDTGGRVSKDTGFIAELDTVIGADTVNVRYEHPRAFFSVAVRQAPDTVRFVERKTVVVEPQPWWRDVAMIVGGAIVGVLATR